MRTRRTKDQIQKDRYNSEVDAYNWYVVNLQTQKAETGFEYKEDAIDLLNDFDDKKKYKVLSKKTLKTMDIEIPNESWKYAKGGSLKAHGIQVGDTFIATVSGTIQKVKDKNGNIVFIDLSNGYRGKQPPLPFAMGGYTDLSKSKPEVINESKMDEYNDEVPEIDIEKIKTIDLDIDNNKILSLDDSIRVLKQIYDKGSINAYEEVKILFLDNSNKVIGIYSHSKGGITGTVVDVEMVCALALKCLAKGVIMSHNHPSGSLKFSEADIKTTRELKNALNLFKIALLDSIVITEFGFTSMTNEGILAYGGGIHKVGNREYPLGRNWSNDHRHHNKLQDYEISMNKRKRFDNGGGNFDKPFNVIYRTKNGTSVVAKRIMAKNEQEAKRKLEKQMQDSSSFDRVVLTHPSFEDGGNLGMGVTNDFKNYVANHTSSESFLYNNRMLSSRGISSKQYELNRNYILKIRSKRGFAGGGEVEFIEYGDSEIMYEPHYKKYYANDMEFDTLEQAKKFIDSGEVPYFIKDAYSKGLFSGGGKTSFAEKSSAIAKNFVGKAVEPKYQKEYGKRYDTKEAKEVGKKIAGTQKSSYDKKNTKP